MGFEIYHRVDTLGNSTLLLIGKFLTLGCAIIMQMFNEVSYIFEGIIRGK